MPNGITAAGQMIYPELFDDAVDAAFANQNAFMGSALKSLGIVIVKGTMPESGPKVIGDTISVPYFESIGDFIDLGGVSNDGTGLDVNGNAVTARQVGMTKESERIQHAVLPFQATEWARSSPLGDAYANAAAQVVLAAQRRMDKACIDAAVNTSIATGLVNDVGTGRQLDYDLFVDSKMLFRDWQDGIKAVLVHDQVLKYLWKLKDGLGRPLLIDSAREGGMPMLHGLPIIASNRLPANGTIAATLTASNGSGSVITTSGPAGVGSAAPTQYMQLLINCVKTGARGTSQIQWSLDNGATWVQDGTFNPYVTTGSGYVDIVDTMGNYTGVTIAFSNASNTKGDTWSATTVSKFTSLIVKQGALAFWFNQAAITLKTLAQPLSDSELAALHLYFVAHRYKRCGGSPLPGIIQILHG